MYGQAYVSLDNLFNHMIMTNVYGYFTGDSPNQNNNVAPGSVMALFYSGRTYGQTPGDAGAKYGDYNFGKAVQQLEVYLGLD